MSTTTAAILRAYRGHPLFSFGFRPFFLFAALWSATAVPIWIAALVWGGGVIGGQDGRAWHVHEMLFGFLPGVMAGFLLTAVPNWTGRLPVTGARLAALVALWGAGRLASLAPPPWVLAAAVVDSAFLVVFAAVIWREVLAGGNWRNAPVCLLVSALALANVAWHAKDLFPAVAAALADGPERAALAVVAALITLIGGRIVPSFTLNWMKAEGVATPPPRQDRFDRPVLGLCVAALAVWTIAPAGEFTGALLVTAGVANGVRLASWRGWRCGREPLVWILHLGYGWLNLGLLLLGLAALRPGLIPSATAVHALTAGAAGVMILGVMTRASLGHTGRPRTAGRATLVIYLMINVAAATRVLAPFAGVGQPLWLAISALLWAGAFGGFVLVYGPMLLRQRPGA